MIKKTYTKKDKEKEQFITDFSAKAYELTVFFDETPERYLKKEITEGKIIVQQIQEGIYSVKTPYDYATLKKWLYFGNWQAIYPFKADFIPIDTFRKKEEDVTAYMADKGIEILIDSFHDDIDWNVFCKA